MQYTNRYHFDLGEILLAADECGLSGLWFYGQKYFAGEEPNFSVPLHLIGTGFQRAVWEILCRIPYGHTTTYVDIARELSAKRGITHMSAQAVGGAVSHNPVSVIVPCHRVIMKNGALGGYAAGTEKKAALLRLEKENVQQILHG